MTGCGKTAGDTANEAAEAPLEAVAQEDGQKHEKTAETPEEAQGAETEATAVQPVFNNPLMNAEMVAHGIMDGSGAAKLGVWASVTIPGAEFEAITPENLYEFSSEAVDRSGYNWFTVRTDGNIGL